MTLTDRTSQVTARTYDALDRLTQIAYHGGATTTFTWDAGDRLVQAVDTATGTITRTYNGLNSVMQEATPRGTISYTYDVLGRRSTTTVLGQPTVSYSWDTADRLTQVTQGTTTVSFALDAANRRTTLTLPNGVVTEYSYDAASRLIGQTFRNGQTVLATLTYEFDVVGNRVQTGGAWARTGLPPAVTSAIYDAANQQVSFSGQTQTYDLNGNMTSDGSASYAWDSANRLVSLSSPSLTATFEYDALGRRSRRVVNSTETRFHYDGFNPVQEVSATGVVANLLTGLGVDHYFARTDAAGMRNHLTDALGSTVAELDATGGPVAEYTYEPFGRTTMNGSSGSALRYTSREDDGTGLYYYRSRYYHPLLHRFLSEDLLHMAGGDILFPVHQPGGNVQEVVLRRQSYWDPPFCPPEQRRGK